MHRFYNCKHGVHFHTMDQNEYESVLNGAASPHRDEGLPYQPPTKLRFSGTGNFTS